MSGNVGHTKSAEAQGEFRQIARKHPDWALLVERLLGEELTDWQVQVIEGSVDERPELARLSRIRRRRDGYAGGPTIIDEIHVWRTANPAIGVYVDEAALREAISDGD